MVFFTMPSNGAATLFSIFMASMTARVWPFLTISPSATLTLRTSPGMGAVSEPTEIIVPSTRFDSEALLALPALAASQVAGRQVLLFKGEGGRDFLAATLLERGASVLPVPCYRRLPPSVDLHALLELQAMGQLDAVVISSSEAMRYLAAMCNENGSDLLKNTLFVVPHARIAESAALLGCANIHLTDAGDEGLLAGLSAYNWASLPSHKS